MAVGGLAYAAIFVSLRIRFGRAVIIGLAYVFVWEGLVSPFIPGVRFVSIRAYIFGIAHAISQLELPSSCPWPCKSPRLWPIGSPHLEVLPAG